MQAGDTITVRGEGGAVFDVDVPPDGSVQRELLDDAIAKGRLTVLSAPVEGVEDERPDDSEPGVQTSGETTDGDTLPPASGDVPDGTIPEVVDWVRGAPVDQEPADGWQERARQALDVEQAKGDGARSTLVDLLSSLVPEGG